MEEELVSFDTAKLAAEKGFKHNNWRNRPIFTEDGQAHPYMAHWLVNHTEFYLRPTQSLLQKWIRETHNLDIEVYMNHEFGVKFYTILILKLDGAVVTWLTGNITKFEKYEEALEVALVEALNLLP